MRESTISDIRLVTNKIGRDNFLKLLLDIECGMSKADVCRKYGLPASYLSKALRHIPSVTLFRLPTCLIGEEGDQTIGGLSEGRVRPVRPGIMLTDGPCPTPSEVCDTVLQDLDNENHAKFLADASVRSLFHFFHHEREVGVRFVFNTESSD